MSNTDVKLSTVLVLVIAICISINLAADVSAVITVRSIYGNAGINGYRLATDDIGINVTSSDGNVSTTNVESQCQCDHRGLYYCVCTFTDTVDTATYGYTVQNGLGETAQALVSVDNSIGNIDFSISSNNGTAVMNYTVQDTGFNGQGRCSGIKTINVFDGDNNINTVDLNTTLNACSSIGSIMLSLTESGQKDMHLEVIDNVGNNASSIHKNITLDITKPDISNLIIKHGGTELNTLAQNVDIPVDIYFDITEDHLLSINVDISSLNTNPAIKQSYKNIIVPLSACSLNMTEANKIYSCIIRNKVLQLNTDNANATITAKDSYGNTNIVSLTKTFTIDNKKPKATITTDACDTKGRCYIKNGLNNININLDKDNFDSRKIYVKVGDNVYPIFNCTSSGNTQCVSKVPITCNSGVIQSSISTTPPYVSMDDSGNMIAPFNVDLYCDNNAPVILNITYSGDYSNGLIISGSTVKIDAVVKELESDELNATVFLDLMKNATEKAVCTKNTDNIINCEWNIINIEDGYYDAHLHFNINDVAGNSASKDLIVRVLGVRADNETPNNLKISSAKLIPEEINRISLALAMDNQIPYFVYAQYSIAVKSGNNIKLLLEKMPGDCTFKSSDGRMFSYKIFSDVTISDEYAKVGLTNRVDFMFAIDSAVVNTLPDSFTAYCNISAYVQEGNYVYKNPQQLTLEVPFRMRNSKLGTPGQVFMDKIKNTEDHFLINFELLGVVNNLIPKVQKICQIKDYLNVASFAGNIISAAGALVSPVFGPGIQNAGMTMTIHTEGVANCLYGGSGTNPDFRQATLPTQVQLPNAPPLSTNTPIGKCTNVVEDMCNFLSCNVAKGYDSSNKPLTDIFNGAEVLNNGILKNANVPDVSNSLVMSIATQCWPGVIYNVNKWRQLDCGYLYCLKETSIKGTDISVCDTSKSVQECSLIMGEAFEIIPPVRFVKNIMNNVGELINGIGPLAAVSIAKSAYCHEYLEPPGTVAIPTPLDSTKIYVCQVPLAVARFIDGIKRTTKAAQFNYPEITDMCEMAKCAGEPNCKSEPNIWQTLNQINIPEPKASGLQYQSMVQNAQKLSDMQKQRYNLVQSFTPEERQYYTSLTANDVEQLKQFVGPKDPGDKAFQVLALDDDIAKLESPIYARSGVNDVNGNPVPIGSLTEEQKQIQQRKELAAYDDFQNVLQREQALKDANGQLNPYQKTFIDDQKQKALFNMGKCGNVADYKQCPKTLSADDIKNIETSIKREDTIRSASQFGDGVYVGLQALYANHVLDWMMSANWGSPLLKVVNFFNAEKWKNNLCNPQLSVLTSSADSGNIVSCDNGVCQPVLTMAAEKLPLTDANGTKYTLYTIAYYIGSGAMQNNNLLHYNVEFRGSGSTIKGFTKVQVVQTNDIVRVQKIFGHTNDFTKMCIVFDSAYPASQIGAQKEYCREIKLNDFNTGTPAGDLFSNYYLQPQNSKQYIYSGTDTTKGVLE